MRHILLVVIALLMINFPGISQSTWSHRDSIDPDLLNQFILQEVNKLRNKVSMSPLQNENLLFAAADDHANYLMRKKKLTHYQIWHPKKKTPKNRVDYYGQQFKIVGENVQQNNLDFEVKLDREKIAQKIGSYERLAKALVSSWKDSKPHYENMISSNYTTTYTAIKVDDDGKVYACQLFGSNPYFLPEETKIPKYKPERPRKCWRCKTVSGLVTVSPDSLIVLDLNYKGFVPNLRQRLAMLRRYADGYAADIVLKNQYPCDTTNVFNGMRGVEGIPLEPVYKKDFRKGNNSYGLRYGTIILGKVPNYIDQEFEVNLTTISNKRTCQTTIFFQIPVYFNVQIPFDLYLDTLSAERQRTKTAFLSERIDYEQDHAEMSDSLMLPIIDLLKSNNKSISKAKIKGFASIEGSTENNLALQKKRAQNILLQLDDFEISTAEVTVETAENFKEFREDIEQTAFFELGKLSDEELKIKLLDPLLMEQLEPILKNHRYAELELNLTWTEQINYTIDTVQFLLKNAIEEKKMDRVREMQSLQANFMLNREMSLDQLYEVAIPRTKKYSKALYNRLMIQYYSDSIGDYTDPLLFLHDSLELLLEIDSANKFLQTQFEIIDFETKVQFHGFGSRKERFKYFDHLRKHKHIDSEVQARLILKLATINDWILASQNDKHSRKKLMHHRVKRYISKARLTVEQTFQIARYYCYFQDNKYAYALTKGLIDDTDDPKNVIFFLKLIHLTNAQPGRSVYLRYFKKARELGGAEFCTYFNSPDINFQIFQDLEIKEIYCEACANR